MYFQTFGTSEAQLAARAEIRSALASEGNSSTSVSPRTEIRSEIRIESVATTQTTARLGLSAYFLAAGQGESKLSIRTSNVAGFTTTAASAPGIIPAISVLSSLGVQAISTVLVTGAGRYGAPLLLNGALSVKVVNSGRTHVEILSSGKTSAVYLQSGRTSIKPSEEAL
jgi:hypothetical protein